MSTLGTFKNEIFEEVKKAKYNDVEDLVFRFQLTYDEIKDILDLKKIPTKKTGCSLNPSIYRVTDLNETLIYILPDNVKVTVTIHDIRLKSNFKIIQILSFTNKRILKPYWVLLNHIFIL